MNNLIKYLRNSVGELGIGAASFMPLLPLSKAPDMAPEVFEAISNNTFAGLYQRLDQIPIRIWEGPLKDPLNKQFQAKFVEYGNANHLMTREKINDKTLEYSLYIDEKNDNTVDFFGTIEVPIDFTISSVKFPLKDVTSMDEPSRVSIQFLYNGIMLRINRDFEKLKKDK